MAQMTTWRTWRFGRTSAPEFMALAALGLFMGAIHAFNVDPPSALARYAYWLITIIGGGVIAAAIEPWLEKAPILAAHPRVRAVAQILVMTFPITALVWFVSGLMTDGGLEAGRAVFYFPSVLVVDIAVVVLAWLLRLAFRPHPVQARAPAPSNPNPLGGRLPPRFARSPLIAVEAEDHYLRVHTEAGETLLYLRFADALTELAAADGLRVHRSWWVARGAVDQVRWKQGRGELTLSGGLKAPVSRTYAGDVRKTGWAVSGGSAPLAEEG